ncbi:WD40 repeat-like protein [Pilatotrama ljubarskyi]|nr:WD40 repeat-like protein [Pilatotrama ljubarskyi]
MSVPASITIKVPSAVSALSLGPNDLLCVGSDDGSLRWYSLPEGRVKRAVKSLGEEISSVVWSRPKKDEHATIWVASGRKIFSFPAESQKMIMTAEDASCVLVVGEDDDDLLNEAGLSLSDNGKLLAFGSDSGAVGTIDVPSKQITRMKIRHTTVCGCVKFIPDRPSELLSGGYDYALLHFDVGQGSILSRYDAKTPPASDGVSLSPPFILSISISSAGLLAASTADGRVWLGGGGEKRPAASQGGKKKRSRKWEGLKEDEGLWLQVADGPVVSTAFRDNKRLVTCSLLGAISAYDISRDTEGSGALQVEKLWSAATSSLEKVNAMVISDTWVVVGGFGNDGKGIVEAWHEPLPDIPQEPAS